ncbi:MAG: hypothetical protein ACYCQJ_13055 [Nitrososphaerales archaeon]
MAPSVQNFQTSSKLWSTALEDPAKKSSSTPSKLARGCKYPIFLDCIRLVSDEFWRSKLEDAAKGKFPAGFLYNNGVLSHRKSKNSLVLPLDPPELVYVFIKFLQQCGSLYSPSELEERRMENRAVQPEKQPITWKTVKACKYQRAIYLEKYVQMKYPDLPDSLKTRLYNLICNFLDVGALKDADIIFEESDIKEIRGIDVVDGKIICEKSLVIPNKKTSKKADSKATTQSHYGSWKKSFKEFIKLSLPGERIDMSSSTNTPTGSLATVDSDDDD